MKTSYHNHTPFCRHASGSPEEYARAAYEGGYEKFGFSDHTPYPFRKGYLPPTRMRIEELPDYVQTVLSLREEYRGKMQIFLGFETEYYPALWQDLLKIYAGYPIDYLLLGQHGFGMPEGDPGCINSFEKTDDAAKLVLFTDTMIEAIGTGKFSCVAHPDVLNYRGDDDLYREQARRLISAAMAKDLPLEVNMYGLADRRHYPNPLFWKEVSALGAKVVLGRDAHGVRRVDPIDEYPEAEEFLRRFDLNLTEDLVLISPNG